MIYLTLIDYCLFIINHTILIFCICICIRIALSACTITCGYWVLQKYTKIVLNWPSVYISWNRCIFLVVNLCDSKFIDLLNWNYNNFLFCISFVYEYTYNLNGITLVYCSIPFIWSNKVILYNIVLLLYYCWISLKSMIELITWYPSHYWDTSEMYNFI
jgi:hypothetical protein